MIQSERNKIGTTTLKHWEQYRCLLGELPQELLHHANLSVIQYEEMEDRIDLSELDEGTEVFLNIPVGTFLKLVEEDYSEWRLDVREQLHERKQNLKADNTQQEMSSVALSCQLALEEECSDMSMMISGYGEVLLNNQVIREMLEEPNLGGLESFYYWALVHSSPEGI